MSEQGWNIEVLMDSESMDETKIVELSFAKLRMQI